ncbi:hypothetical protein L6164_023200 [Bauhinia variegata]|uniref:Uncharacterized protein n=1 Tax=Bauhinia variegata TaxID=167791 RepID=A0ACB9MHI1_BAUVA|nr:hypothetical protein L6164_023200 [Bauhinia variegata]
MEGISKLNFRLSIPITLVVGALLSLTIVATKAQTPIYLWDDCENSTEHALSSTSKANIYNILSWLTSNAGARKTYNNSIGMISSEEGAVYGLYDCRDDMDISSCPSCVAIALTKMLGSCQNRVSAVVWYDYCVIRYSNQNFIGSLTLEPNWISVENKNISNPSDVDTTENYMKSLIRKATEETNRLYAMGEFSLSNGEKRYGMVQCSRDLSKDECAQCLEAMLGKVPRVQKLGWTVAVPSCLVKYQELSPAAKKGGNNRSTILIISIISALVGIALLNSFICYFLLQKRMKKETLVGTTPTNFQSNIQSENSYEELPIVPFITIQESTNNFSEASKLGEGGFGPVYKGILPDGREIAVKRLSKTSVQGLEEFKNELMGKKKKETGTGSFGVLMLEIICGQRNSGFYLSNHGQSLLVYTWKLWCEGKSLELVDPTLEKSYIDHEVARCIHIGLLCVQEDAADRPTMSGVVLMLGSDKVTLRRPNRPAFSVGRIALGEESSMKSPMDPSINDVTVSNISPR